MQQPVVQNYSQWPPVMSQPGIQPQNFAQPQYQVSAYKAYHRQYCTARENFLLAPILLCVNGNAGGGVGFPAVCSNHNRGFACLQSHMVAGQPLYRAVGPQPAVQPSLPQALPVQQQRPLTDEDRRIIPKRVR